MMRTLRKMDPINRTFIKDLSQHRNDDFIAKPERRAHAVVSLRNRHAIINGYLNGPKSNVFAKVYQWNPDAEMVLFLKMPVRLSDHVRHSIKDSDLAVGLWSKNDYFDFHSFDNDSIKNGQYEQLITYLDEMKRVMTA